MFIYLQASSSNHLTSMAGSGAHGYDSDLIQAILLINSAKDKWPKWFPHLLQPFLGLGRGHAAKQCLGSTHPRHRITVCSSTRPLLSLVPVAQACNDAALFPAGGMTGSWLFPRLHASTYSTCHLRPWYIDSCSSAVGSSRRNAGLPEIDGSMTA